MRSEDDFFMRKAFVFTPEVSLVWPLLTVQSRPHDAGRCVNFTLTIGPLISLIAGILILVIPRLLNYIVALYLIIIGLIGLLGGSQWRIV